MWEDHFWKNARIEIEHAEDLEEVKESIITLMNLVSQELEDLNNDIQLTDEILDDLKEKVDELGE